MLDPVLFTRIMDEVQRHVAYLTFYFQGEPYLNPHFLDLVQIAESKKVYTATSTNAHYLDEVNARRTVESGLSRLIISVDGATQETYQQYRVGGSLDKVLEGARNVVEWRKKLRSATPFTVFQFLVVKPNEHEMNDMLRIAKEVGVDKVVFKKAQIYDFEHGSPLIPDNPRFSRYVRKPDGSWTLRHKLENRCWKMWHSCVITWDGKVVPCCFDKDAKYVMGDLNSQSLKTIWNNEKYNAFRRQLFQKRDEIDICRNCSEGANVFTG